MSPFLNALLLISLLLLLVKSGESNKQSREVTDLYQYLWSDLEDEFAETEELFEKFDKDELEHSKRGFGSLFKLAKVFKVGGKLLFGASILTSGINIGYSAWMVNEGCCKQMKFCRQQRTLKNSVAALKKRLNDRDAIAGNGKRKGNWVLGIHNNNEILRLKIQSILDSVDEILTLLDVDTKNKFERYVAEFKQTLDGRKDEISKWTDTDLQHTNMWSTQSGRLQLFGTLFAELGAHGAGKMWKRYKRASMRKALGKEFAENIMRNNKARHGLKGVVLTTGPMSRFNKKSFISKTADARYRARYGKAAKFANGLAGALSALSIAADLAAIFEQQKQCNKIKDIVLDRYRIFEARRDTIDKDIRSINRYNKEIDKSYVNLTASLRTEDFKNGLLSIKTLVDEAQNPKKDISKTISNFVNKIDAAEKQQIVDLQKALTKMISKVQFRYKCLAKKANILKNLERSCRNGKKTFEEIYAPLYNENKFKDCNASGVSYFSKEKSKEVIAKAFEQDNKAHGTSKSINCRLNGHIKYICTNRCEGVVTADIKKKLKNNKGVTAAPAEIDAINCSKFFCHLDKADRQFVCQNKGAATDPVDETAKKIMTEEDFSAAMLPSIKCAVSYSQKNNLKGRRGCKGHFKSTDFSEIKYEEYCKQVTSTPAAGTTYIICEWSKIDANGAVPGEVKSLECPQGKKIRINRANYGRTKASPCPRDDGVNQSFTCTSSSKTIDIVRKKCENKMSCELQAQNSEFGDPCRGVTKYLDVEFVCVPVA